MRHLIVAGLADPRVTSDVQAAQGLLSVRACCALAREYYLAGYDVAIDDIMSPGDWFDENWRKGLVDIDWRLVIVHPSLEETLRRSKARAKRVPEHLTREHYGTMKAWPPQHKIDTTGLNLTESLALVEAAVCLEPPGLQSDWEL